MTMTATFAAADLAAPSSFRMTFPRPGPRAWVRVGAAATEATVFVNGAEIGRHLGAWTPFEFEISKHLQTENELEVRCVDRIHVTNGFLPAIGVRWTGARDVEIRTEPTPPRPPARQRSAVRGTQLLVDGRPFRVRGILHWGYYPERPAPWPDEDQMRREIRDMQSLGFNLIKFCLWIPPERYYQLCDEMGMFVWQEYPVWDAPLTDRSVVDEFREFFRHDAPYPCVILRTLTCENDRVAPEIARELVDLCHEMIPGAVVLDNSGWLCAERYGDFHDEHIYLNNQQIRYYGRRMRGKLTKPLLIGEGFKADCLGDCSCRTAVKVVRYQVETLARDIPDAGYVINAIRDTQHYPTGLYSVSGRLKHDPADWAWQRDEPAPPREIPEPTEPIIGPRKGQWKCPDHTWWSPIVRVLDPTLPARLIEEECVFELFTGRVLERCEGTRVLVELWDLSRGTIRRLPLVIEFTTEGRRRVVSAFRHDTPAGRRLWEALAARRGPAPEIGPLVGTSIVLEDWEMSIDGQEPVAVKCDEPLVNHGRNVFEGWATFRTWFDYPGGRRILRCEAVGDYYEFSIDGRRIGEAGPREGTWDGTRDIPREFEVDLEPGRHEIVFRVRDWRGAGGMVGPVYFATDLTERVF